MQMALSILERLVCRRKVSLYSVVVSMERWRLYA